MDTLRHTGQLPTFGRPFDAITHFRQLPRKPGMKGRFKIGRIGFQIPKLSSLPFLFRFIPCGVKSVAVRVQMRIGNGH